VNADLVIPTCGRTNLGRLLASIAAAGGPPGRVLVVDDRRSPSQPLPLPGWAQQLRGRAAGPAAARNRGWRASRAEWVCFLDDDTELPAGWFEQLERDLTAASGSAASQGRIKVPRPPGRRPTDAERAVIGLEDARYATADMAYRRRVLAHLGGFDERFPRPYREDSELALRVLGQGMRIEQGRRTTLHPLPVDGARSALRRQAGNRDDLLMGALHGRGWRERAGAPRGRLRRHVAITCGGLVTLVAGAAGRRRTAAFVGGATAAAITELAWARIAPGPRTRSEVAELLASSVVLPPVAAAHLVLGLLELPQRLQQAPSAVLLDRDGTLIEDVPSNTDPALLRPMPGAAEALARLRRAGVPTAVVTNQACIGRGLATAEQVAAVNRRVEQLLGPLGPWFVCPHTDSDGCRCRKPAAGLLLDATRALGVDRSRAALIGDTAADMDAARAAGMRGVLVPTPVTLRHELADATEVADNLGEAVDLLLGSAA
jgi:histidinol-phosphate phosphatase family protein